MTNISERPSADEHAPWAVTYMEATERAFLESGHRDLYRLLEEQISQLPALFDGHHPTFGAYAYEANKWTSTESLVHVSDTERVFAYRLMRVARNDATPLPGFDQDAWVPESRANERSLQSAIDEFVAVRRATIALIGSLDGTALSRRGTASNHTVSARALVWMISGHVAHHIRIFEERYLRKAVGH